MNLYISPISPLPNFLPFLADKVVAAKLDRAVFEILLGPLEDIIRKKENAQPEEETPSEGSDILKEDLQIIAPLGNTPTTFTDPTIPTNPNKPHNPETPNNPHHPNKPNKPSKYYKSNNSNIPRARFVRVRAVGKTQKDWGNICAEGFEQETCAYEGVLRLLWALEL